MSGFKSTVYKVLRPLAIKRADKQKQVLTPGALITFGPSDHVDISLLVRRGIIEVHERGERTMPIEGIPSEEATGKPSVNAFEVPGGLPAKTVAPGETQKIGPKGIQSAEKFGKTGG